MKGKRLISFTSVEKSQLIASGFIGLLAAIPISLMVPMYMDDFQRSLRGSFDWVSDGRPLAELIYRIGIFDSPGTVLTSPLGTLLCIPGICLSSLLICKIFDHRKPWAAAMAAVFIFIQPYFIENLSYSFDSPFMVFAILLSLCAAYLIVYIHNYLGALLAVFLSICSLSLYQPANVALWIPVVLFVLLRSSNHAEPQFSLASISVWRFPHSLTRTRSINIVFSMVVCQFLSLLIYKIIVLGNVRLKVYAAKHAPMPNLPDLPNTVVDNIITYLRVLSHDWAHTKFGIVFFLFLLIFMLLASLQSIYYRRNKHSRISAQWSSMLSFALTISVLIFVFILSYGVGLILADPVFHPRTFIGIGVFMACISLSVSRDLRFDIGFNTAYRVSRSIRDLIVSISLIATVWACVYILFAYSNAYISQQRLNEFYLSSIVSQIRDNGYGYQDIAGVMVHGQSPYSPVTLNTFRTLPYLDSFIQPIKSNWWAHIRLRHYGLIKLKRHKPIQQGETIFSDPLYDLSIVDRSLIVKFKN